MTEIYKSKKFIMAIVGIILVIANRYSLDLDEAIIEKIVYLIMAYVTGQGLADFGKEANK